MTTNHALPEIHIAPLPLMFGGLVFIAVMLILAIMLATRTPSLGFSLASAPDQSGLRVDKISNRDLENRLKVGDILTGYESTSGQRHPLNPDTLIEDPFGLPTYAQYNEFMQNQGRISEALNSGSITLVTSTGEPVTIPTHSYRTLAELPWEFWLMQFEGAIAMMLGTALWSFRKRAIEVLLVLTSGLGFYIKCLLTPIFSYREMALDPALFQPLSAINQLGGTILVISIICLIFVYPLKIAKPWGIATISALAMFFWGNRVFQWLPLPAHDHYSSFAVAFALLGLGVYLQWVRTELNPVNRAILKWMIVSVVFSLSLAVASWYLPHIINREFTLPLAVAFSFMLLMYIGIMLGILRYRLFDLDKWWFEIWLWFFAGLIVITIDAIVLTIFQLGTRWGLLIGLIISGWLYFPIRQWLQKKLVFDSQRKFENFVPELLSAVYSTGLDEDLPSTQLKLLERIYQPLNLKIENTKVPHSKIRNHGAEIITPLINSDDSIVLSYANKGNALFKPKDEKLIEGLRNAFSQYARLNHEKKESAREERQRIIRDLHDDVASTLLSLIHDSGDAEKTEQLARTALQSLRETIYTLDDRTTITLDELLDDLRENAADRLEGNGLTLTWDNKLEHPGVVLSGREKMNITRILQEAVSNTLKFSEPGTVDIEIRSKSNQLELKISNEIPAPDSDLVRGKGLNNIQTRAKELGGHATWHLQKNNHPPQFILTISLQLNDKEDDEYRIDT